jgi:CheY-like chemotaxis protein
MCPQADGSRAQEGGMSRHCILCVDDEPHILTALRRVFMELDGHVTVLTARNAQEALALIAENSLSVIISDQRMPGMSGTEFLARARVIAPNALRILLTGYIEARTLEEAVNQGQVFRFISKPWDNGELLAAVREALALYARSVRSSGAAVTSLPEHPGRQAARHVRELAAAAAAPAPAPPIEVTLVTEALAPPEAPTRTGPLPERATAVTTPMPAAVQADPTARLLEAMPFAMFCIDELGTIRTANAFARRLCRLSHLPVIGSHFTSALPPELRRTVDRSLGAQDVQEEDEVVLHGLPFHVECRPFTDARGAGALALLLFPRRRAREAPELRHAV